MKNRDGNWLRYLGRGSGVSETIVYVKEGQSNWAYYPIHSSLALLAH